MPDIPNRADLEGEFARIMGRLGARQRKRLLELLGDPPDLSRIGQTFWTEAGAELTAALRPMVENIYLEAAQRIVEATPIGVDWALVNTGASTWAQQYTFDLVSGINNTTRDSLRQFVSGFFEEPVDLGELRAKLEQLYGPVRADMIATTEVTRAAAQGELATARELEKEGITMARIWATNRDEIVCPICGPLDGEPEEIWRDESPDGPPAHPRCRCWLNLEFQGGQ